MSNVKKLVYKDPVDVLTAEWLNIKHAEKELQKRRHAIEDELLTHIAAVKEGTVHINQSLKAQFKLTRKVDSDALDAIWDKLPDNIQAAFEWTAVPQLKELRKVENDALLEGIVSESTGRPTFTEKGEQS